MSFANYVIITIAGYLLGSIPTGYLVGKAKGVDIRTVGSKNMGATNVFRTLGKRLGIFVLIVDGLKGFAACAWVCSWLFGMLNVAQEDQSLLRIIAGIAAVLGHNYTCWLQFKGGKGIATTAGVYFALAPWAASVALAAWIIFLVVTRYVSIASLAAAVALPAAVWLTQDSLLLGIVTTALGALAIYKHKANIQRLRAGTENKIQFKKERAAT